MQLTPFRNKLKNISIQSVLRTTESGNPFIADEGNYILDCDTGEILNIESLSQMLHQITGIVENGLFERTVLALRATHRFDGWAKRTEKTVIAFTQHFIRHSGIRII